MTLRKVEIYGSMDCPYPYLAAYRLRKFLPRFPDGVKVVWRCLSLEYVNRRPVVQPLIEAERALFAQIEPDLPYEAWAMMDIAHCGLTELRVYSSGFEALISLNETGHLPPSMITTA